MARDRFKFYAFSGDLIWRGRPTWESRLGESPVVRGDNADQRKSDISDLRHAKTLSRACPTCGNADQHAPRKWMAVSREAYAMSSILARKPLHQVGALSSKLFQPSALIFA